MSFRDSRVCDHGIFLEQPRYRLCIRLIDVVLHRSKANRTGIISVTVTDDGHGMSLDVVVSAFRWIEDSWKHTTQVPMVSVAYVCGEFRQGRLRTFAFEIQVRCSTVANDGS